MRSRKGPDELGSADDVDRCCVFTVLSFLALFCKRWLRMTLRGRAIRFGTPASGLR